MNMPGFTAETSLHKTSGHYRAMAGTPNGCAEARGVLPQLPISPFIGEWMARLFSEAAFFGGESSGGAWDVQEGRCRLNCWRRFRDNPVRLSECIGEC